MFSGAMDDKVEEFAALPRSDSKQNATPLVIAYLGCWGGEGRLNADHY
jgi:hypothetical protein